MYGENRRELLLSFKIFIISYVRLLFTQWTPLAIVALNIVLRIHLRYSSISYISVLFRIEHKDSLVELFVQYIRLRPYKIRGTTFATSKTYLFTILYGKK